MATTTSPETPRKLAYRKFPLKVLREWAGSIINGETGELLEYHHLRKTQSTEIHGESLLETKLSAFPKE